MKLKVISLYTGAGGLDLGLEAAGFEPLACVEMNGEAVATLTANRPRWPAIHGKLVPKAPCSSEEITPEEVVQEAAGQPDLLAGGPPCQPFSKSGYWYSGDSARLEDPRANTLDSYLRTLELAQPRAFLLENVPGLAFNNKSEGLNMLRRRIRAINRRAGTSYTFQAARLNASEFGVPQLRERVFVIGSRDGVEFEFPDPYTTAWDAIGHLDHPELDDDDDLRVRGKYADLLPTIPEGCNYLFHADKGGTRRKLFGWRTRYWSMLLKLEKSRPSWTLTAQPGPAIGPFHWKNRRLSAAELCALQTFPADYKIHGNCRSAHRQVGNAVPSALIELLGLEIRRQFFGQKVRRKPRLLPELRDSIPGPSAKRRAATRS